VDTHGNFFFEELLRAFTECKVILSVREEDSWIESYVRQLEFVYAVHLRSNIYCDHVTANTARKFDYVLYSSIYVTLFFLYKIIFYKNIEADICKILRIF